MIFARNASEASLARSASRSAAGRATDCDSAIWRFKAVNIVLGSNSDAHCGGLKFAQGLSEGVGFGGRFCKLFELRRGGSQATEAGGAAGAFDRVGNACELL